MNQFTQEEIKSAKEVKEEMIAGNMPKELIAIYMAGEICMWDELKNPSIPPVQGEQETQLLKDLLKLIDRYRKELNDTGNSCANHVYNDITEHLAKTK